MIFGLVKFLKILLIIKLSTDKTKLTVNFYKSYLESETNTDIENYYKLMSRKL